jgi:Transposase IS116/IS110/IS902 family
VPGEFGDAPDRYLSAKSRRNYAGTSSITRASGTRRAVLARHARNKRLADAVYLWAFAALSASPGARAFYDHRRTAGDTHNQALRTLGNRLVDNQLHAPVILVWDNLNAHVSAMMRCFIEAHPDWLTEVRLPAYAPISTPSKAFGQHEDGLGNLAATDIDQLTEIVKNRLKRIQHRPTLIDGFLAQTGLSLEPEPP